MRKSLIATFVISASAFAQAPLIYNRSIYNAASYTPPGIPSGAIARGSIFSMFGARLGPATPATANSYPLGTTLDVGLTGLFSGLFSMMRSPRPKSNP